MNRQQGKFLFLLVAGTFMMAGCATTRARHAETPDPASQIKVLQDQVQAKDQQIQDLQAQLDSSRQSLPNDFSGNKPDKSSVVRVAGVSVTDVQKALSRAGFDPGPVDGRAGKKTKSAIKSFQKKHHVKADGIVGEKTWELMRA